VLGLMLACEPTDIFIFVIILKEFRIMILENMEILSLLLWDFYALFGGFLAMQDLMLDRHSTT
jgi:hypothetical protein